MSNDCWTCRYYKPSPEFSFCEPEGDENDGGDIPVNDWLGEHTLLADAEDEHGFPMPPQDGTHPDCPGHEPQDPTP